MTRRTRASLTLALALVLCAIVPAGASAAPPYNDPFSSYQTISSLSAFAGSNVDSTTETDTVPAEATQLQTLTGWGIHNTVWHVFNAPASGEVSFTVCSTFPSNVIATVGSTIPTLSLPSAAMGPVKLQGMTQLNSGGDPSGCDIGEYPAVLGPIHVSAGDVLRPVVSSAWPDNTGFYTISTAFTPSPANDDLANRVELFSRHKVTGTNLGASTEQNEANNPYTNWRSVWYSFTAPATSTVNIDVCSDFALNLVTYNGSSYPLAPQSYAQGNVPGGCGDGLYYTYLTNVAVTAGQELMIQVGGYNGYEYNGNFDISVNYNGVPPNDLWANAKDLGSGYSAVDYGDNTNSSTSPEMPKIDGTYRSSSVWYQWTAPATGPVRIDTCDGPLTTANLMLAVFDRNDVVADDNNAVQVAVDHDSCSGNRDDMGSLTLSAVQGTTYLIVVSAELQASPAYSDFTLQIRNRPTNTVAPALSGSGPFVGNQLSATTGTWVGAAPIAYAYQWERCDSGGANCVDIGGAQASTYTLASGDLGNTVRVRVDASNAAGSASAESQSTSAIDDDTDGDGVGDSVDNCPNNAQGSGKTNGCPVENVSVGTAPSLSGSPQVGTTITASPGAASNSPGIDASVSAPTKTINWLSCPAADSVAAVCDGRGSGPSNTTYQPADADIGRYIKVQVAWTNGDSQQAFPTTSALGPVFKDSDGDGVHDDVDNCVNDAQEAPKTNGCPVIGVIVTGQPVLSGVAKVGQQLTATAGSAENETNLDSSVTDPTHTLTTWQRCPSDQDTVGCVTISGASGLSYTATAADSGKFLLVTVTWANEDGNAIGEAYSSAVAAADPPPAPPVPPVGTPQPLTISNAIFPKRATAAKIIKSKGKFTIKQVQLACPVGGAACTFSYSLTAKLKKKKVKLGTSTQSVAAGAAAALSGKLSKAGLKLFKKNKKLKATLSVTASGGATGKATFKEFTITK